MKANEVIKNLRTANKYKADTIQDLEGKIADLSTNLAFANEQIKVLEKNNANLNKLVWDIHTAKTLMDDSFGRHVENFESNQIKSNRTIKLKS